MSMKNIGGAVAVALGAGVGVAGLVMVRRKLNARRGKPMIASVTINRSIEDVYAFVHDLDQLAEVIGVPGTIERIGNNRARWTAKLPLGKSVSWDVELLGESRCASISWHSVAESPLQACGRVTFSQPPGRDATELRAEIQFVRDTLPGTVILDLLGKPKVLGLLRDIKSVLETGEVLQSDASVHQMPHAAQPSEQHDVKSTLFIEHPPTAEKGRTGVMP